MNFVYYIAKRVFIIGIKELETYFVSSNAFKTIIQNNRARLDNLMNQNANITHKDNSSKFYPGVSSTKFQSWMQTIRYNYMVWKNKGK